MQVLNQLVFLWEQNDVGPFVDLLSERAGLHLRGELFCHEQLNLYLARLLGRTTCFGATPTRLVHTLSSTTVDREMRRTYTTITAPATTRSTQPGLPVGYRQASHAIYNELCTPKKRVEIVAAAFAARSHHSTPFLELLRKVLGDMFPTPTVWARTLFHLWRY